MRVLRIQRNNEGWGGPLEIEIKPGKKVLSITGTGIHPLAAAIAKVAGVEVCDGFKDPVADEDVLCVVINCAGTLRCGVYPKKNIPTVNVNKIGPSGPLAEFIKEDNYISGVVAELLEVVEDGVITKKSEIKKEEVSEVKEEVQNQAYDGNFAIKLAQIVGGWTGKYTSMFYSAGKEAVEIVIKTVIPYMAFISVLVGIILYTGIGTKIANALIPLASSLPGLLLISIICGLPFLSPLLGAGAAVAQVIGVLIGVEIGKGNIPPQYALPALFAINIQVGADFVPVGLSMQEATPDTIKYGTPAFLISRCITGPICVIVAYLFSIGMY